MEESEELGQPEESAEWEKLEEFQQSEEGNELG